MASTPEFHGPTVGCPQEPPPTAWLCRCGQFKASSGGPGKVATGSRMEFFQRAMKSFAVACGRHRTARAFLRLNATSGQLGGDARARKNRNSAIRAAGPPVFVRQSRAAHDARETGGQLISLRARTMQRAWRDRVRSAGAFTSERRLTAGSRAAECLRHAHYRQS